MNTSKSTTESAVSATIRRPFETFEVIMELHLVATDLRVAWAALNDGKAEALMVADVAVQLDRMQRRLDDLAADIDLRGVAE